jgi:hypothetical protein
MPVRSLNGPDVTIIRGAIGSPTRPNDPDPIYAVRGAYLASDCLLLGFTVESSCALSTNSAANGSGIWMGSSSVVSNCIIRNNTGAYAGGGVYLESDAELTDSTVQSNDARISGGGICMQGGTVNRCIIKENVSDYEGGGVFLTGTLNNSVVDGNEATHSGGGLFIKTGSANNCTILNNKGRRGAGVCLSGVGASLDNSIVVYSTAWDGNLPGNILNNGGTMRYCMQGTPSEEAMISFFGNGNLYISHKAFSFKPGTYEIGDRSICVDWGENTHAPTSDALGGTARIINGRVDLGAYETSGSMEDANGNGISDDWEQHFYGSNPPPASSLCSNGVNTVEEAYIAGIDPTNPNSRFTAWIDSETGSIFWPLAYGRTYSIYWTPELGTPFGKVAEVSWRDGLYLDADHDSDGAGFYKVEVQ